jgi:hypothetical protein
LSISISLSESLRLWSFFDVCDVMECVDRGDEDLEWWAAVSLVIGDRDLEQCCCSDLRFSNAIWWFEGFWTTGGSPECCPRVLCMMDDG